jgi:cyclopropane-fatty-acyl-phospholipid synthase
VRLGNSVSPGIATSLASTFGSLIDGDLGSALTEVWSQITQRRLVAVKASPGVLARLVAVAVRAGALGGPLPPPATQARLRGRLHSPSRDRAAIRHHYDTSNAFYRLILDPSMAYSCAYWEGFSSNLTLAQAQYDKLDRICRKLGLDEQPGMRLLDVGCGWGWGWLSLHAAEQYGARVLGVTLSGEQKDYIDAALTERGLGDRVEIRSRITALSRTDPLTQRRPSRWANTSAHRTTRPMPESCTAPFAPAPGC